MACSARSAASSTYRKPSKWSNARFAATTDGRRSQSSKTLQVVGLPFYETLDGKTTEDYVQRVEPSIQGGEKMAKVILDRLEPHLKGAASQSSQERRRRTSEPGPCCRCSSSHNVS